MAAAKRTKIQREYDLVQIATLYRRGHSQMEIAEYIAKNRDYTLSRNVIGRDIRTLQARWIEASVRDFDELRAEQLAKIDELERTYWTAWESSREEEETTRQEGDVDGVERVTRTTRKRSGNAEYLRGVERCIERRCKLLGLDAPSRSEIEVREITFDVRFADDIPVSSNDLTRVNQ